MQLSRLPRLILSSSELIKEDLVFPIEEIDVSPPQWETEVWCVMIVCAVPSNTDDNSRCETSESSKKSVLQEI